MAQHKTYTLNSAHLAVEKLTKVGFFMHAINLNEARQLHSLNSQDSECSKLLEYLIYSYDSFMQQPQLKEMNERL